MIPEGLIRAITGVSTIWSLAAFAIAALLFLIPAKSRVAIRLRYAIAAGICLIALASLYLDYTQRQPSVYELRTVVLDPQNTPVEDAKVWSSLGGEPKRIAGGWQFDIPTTSVPADHKLIIYADLPAAFLKGQADLTLASDFHPHLTIHLARTETTIRGMVTNTRGAALLGVKISVVGYGAETVTTQPDGSFVLPAHAAEGQQVQLHAEAPGFTAITAWHPAGVTSVTLELARR